jgi:adenosylmethionine-8-amino-7-oxononanoate aminotransferase
VTTHTAPPSATALLQDPQLPAEADVLLDYHRQPRVYAVRGNGAQVEDGSGAIYWDAVSHVGATGIGLGVSEIAVALREQAEQLSFASTRHFVTRPGLELAAAIGELTPAGLTHCWFGSSGAEAVESAIQIARQYWQAEGQPRKVTLIGQERSYHGGTIGAISLGGHTSHRNRMQPYLLSAPAMLLAPATPAEGANAADMAQALERLILDADPATVAAVVLEKIGATTSGAVVPPGGWHQAVRELCDRYDILLIADEVTTAFGRTGRWFADDYWPGSQPDILIGGKTLHSGYTTLSVVIGNDKVARGLQQSPERLGVRFTSAGNPLSCAAGLAVLRYIQRENLVDRCYKAGEELRLMLASLAETSPHVGTPRGLGLEIGLPLWQDAAGRVPFPRQQRVMEAVVDTAFRRHNLVIAGGSGTHVSADGDHLMITPYLGITPEESATITGLIADSLDDMLRPGSGAI